MNQGNYEDLRIASVIYKIGAVLVFLYLAIMSCRFLSTLRRDLDLETILLLVFTVVISPLTLYVAARIIDSQLDILDNTISTNYQLRQITSHLEMGWKSGSIKEILNQQIRQQNQLLLEDVRKAINEAVAKPEANTGAESTPK